MKSLIFSTLFLSTTLFAQEGISEQSLQKLIEGNARFMKDQSSCPDRNGERRAALVSSQSPFAVIVGCSDSRVSPEIIFDQGVGDLFVVRVAGNVVGPIELDSVEYSAIYLGSSIIVVLGHEGCAAVKAVQKGTTKDIEEVARLIQPSIQKGATLEESVKANVLRVVKELKSSSVINRLINQKKINVVGGYYHLESGKVEIIK